MQGLCREGVQSNVFYLGGFSMRVNLGLKTG